MSSIYHQMLLVIGLILTFIFLVIPLAYLVFRGSRVKKLEESKLNSSEIQKNPKLRRK